MSCLVGELYSFGKGLNGRLGSGSTANISTPTLVAGSASLRFNKLYSGKEFIVASTDDNKLYAWGRNNKGQIGNGTKVDVMTPTKLTFNGSDTADIKTISVGDDYVILIKQNNSMECWGANDKGQFPYDGTYKVGTVANQLATKTATNYPTPTTPLPAISDAPVTGSIKYLYPAINEATSPIKVTSLIDARNTTAYTLSNGTMNTSGGNYNPTESSGSLNGTKSGENNIYDISRTWYHSTSIGAKAIANINWIESPNVLNLYPASRIAMITHLQAGGKHGYLTYDGKVYSWGDNSLKQQSSDYTTSGMLSPAATINSFINTLNNTGGGFSEMTVAHDTNYILSGSGNVYVWGSNDFGKAGTGSNAAYIDTPTALTTLNGKTIAKVVPGRNGVHYISHTGDVYYTGDNYSGQSGLGDAYAGDSKITSPEKIETFKFSDTATPPDAPDTVNTPDEVEAGTVIEIQWSEVASATEYELVRYATPKSAVMTFALPSAELVYSGDQSKCSDIALESWDNVSYGLRAVNFIGDKSSEVTSSAVNVLSTSGSGGNNNGGDNNNNNNSNNSNNNSGGGMSSEQLTLILAALKNNGASDDLIAAILAASKKSSNVNVTTPTADNKDLLALIATLATNNGNSTAQPVPGTTVYNQGADGEILKALIEYLINSSTDGEPAPVTVDTLDAALKVATLKTLDTLGTQLSKTEPVYYQPQQTGGLTAKTVSLYIIIIMILAAGALVVINIIPLADEEEECDAD